jgi:phage recombination protein Bet
MSTALTTLTSKLAAKLDMGTDGSSLIETLKATAFKGQVNDAQMTALLVIANQYGLNPWTKEIYAFPDKGAIVPVVGVDGWARIINSHPQFDGMEFEQNDEQCTCIMYRKDRTRPVKVTEYMVECRRANVGPWQSHPRRMLRHKAMIQCARLAFGFGGIYDHDEAERITERDMGAAEVVSSRPAQPATPAALPDYSQSAFADNLPKWSAAILSGKLTADEVITRASTKGALSEAQKAQIRAAAKPAPAPEPEPEVIDAPEQKAQADDDGWIEDYESTEAAQ